MEEIEFPKKSISKTVSDIKYGECCIFESEIKTVYMRVNTKNQEVFIPMINLKTAIITEFPFDNFCIPVKTNLKVMPHND